MSIYKTPFRSLMCLCIILGLIGLFRQAEAHGVTVTSISPVVGKVGDEVTIVGTNFSTTASENLVDFSGVMGTVTSATATELKVTVPAGALVGPISVTVGGASRPIRPSSSCPVSRVKGAASPRSPLATSSNSELETRIRSQSGIWMGTANLIWWLQIAITPLGCRCIATPEARVPRPLLPQPRSR